MNRNKTIGMVTSLVVALLLSGCEPAQDDPVLSTKEKWYVVKEIKRGKRFKVSFRDEVTGQVLLMKLSSSNCSSRRNLQLESRWLLAEVVRQGKNSAYTELEGKSDLCAKLRAM
jgi:hypothetical protein